MNPQRDKIIHVVIHVCMFLLVSILREELTEEQFMVGNQLRIEFEHHGVHLETSKRNELYQLQDEIMYVP